MEPVAEALQLHPAIAAVSAGNRRPGRPAVAALVRLVSRGMLSVSYCADGLHLRPVPGVATPLKTPTHGPFVKREHVDGLQDIDRKLLVLLFDHVACSTEISVERLITWAAANPSDYWRSLHEWHVSVRAKSQGRISRATLRRLREEVLRVLGDQSVDARVWCEAAAFACALELDRALYDSASGRLQGTSGTANVAAVVLCSHGSWPRTQLRELVRLLSPWRPSSYLPAQHTGLVVPFWYRVRTIDDGSQRLGG